ncbi:glycosyltransferase [Bacillus massiliglaciei]|uniref:glycosyltransferase n=1 Tax=Bacillus massiliglaciei TaxID=1816693 RepID=UPI000B207A14|nr:glycosyltransferase [Bacillus massiliglaciei]
MMKIEQMERRLLMINKEQTEIRKAIRNGKERLNLIQSGDIEGYLNNELYQVPFILDTYDEEYIQEYLAKKEREAQKNYFSEVEGLLESISDSNGSRYFEKRNVNVGIIADEFLYQSFKDVANFTYLTYENYKEHIQEQDVFLVATTWKGLGNEWRGVANPASNRRRELYEMIREFKKKNKKVVFYSKEDPVNYDKFIDIAAECDYIFTTAIEKVEDYKNHCQNQHVFVLEFGINPLYHNPINMKKQEKRKEIFFAGSWLNKYPDRQKETETIFDGLIEANQDLLIIDRNYSINHPDYFFPEKYLKYIAPSIPHHYLQKIHKLYDWGINLNSVKYSDTMFANRVYELQALGNLVISNYSVGVNNKFPNVFMVHDKKEAGEILLSMNEEEVYQHQVSGIREVFRDKTTFDRFDYLLECIGMASKDNSPKRAAVVVKTKNEQVLKSFHRQSYDCKELILEKDFNEEIREKYDFIAFFDETSTYKEYYLEDMINGFKYTDSDYITKDGYYRDGTLMKGSEHDYVGVMKNKFRSVFSAKSFSAEDLLHMNGEAEIPNGYSIDHFEYDERMARAVKPAVHRQYALSVIIPVYNNGKHLLFKCFQSLKRSSIFDEMEIILIDDGSTDWETLAIIDRLSEEYPNVKTFYYKGGGSGSASRPRNKGAELASAAYVTYLDPDNEAINDGYSQLLEVLQQNEDLDMAIGNMVKFDNVKRGAFNYYKTVSRAIQKDTITNAIPLLRKTDLRAQSIQAVIVKKEIIQKNNLKMIENAGGQDTLFFYELLLHAKKTQVIDLDIHIYYAAVSGSVTNTVSKKFFHKYFVLEKEKLPFLLKHDLLEAYMSTRFNFYFENWYLKRIKYLEEKDAKEALDILYEIYTLYEPHIEVLDEGIKGFVELYKAGEVEEILSRFSE